MRLSLTTVGLQDLSGAGPRVYLRDQIIFTLKNKLVDLLHDAAHELSSEGSFSTLPIHHGKGAGQKSQRQL